MLVGEMFPPWKMAKMLWFVVLIIFPRISGEDSTMTVDLLSRNVSSLANLEKFLDGNSKLDLETTTTPMATIVTVPADFEQIQELPVSKAVSDQASGVMDNNGLNTSESVHEEKPTSFNMSNTGASFKQPDIKSSSVLVSEKPTSTAKPLDHSTQITEQVLTPKTFSDETPVYEKTTPASIQGNEQSEDVEHIDVDFINVHPIPHIQASFQQSIFANKSLEFIKVLLKPIIKLTKPLLIRPVPIVMKLPVPSPRPIEVSKPIVIPEEKPVDIPVHVVQKEKMPTSTPKPLPDHIPTQPIEIDHPNDIQVTDPAVEGPGLPIEETKPVQPVKAEELKNATVAVISKIGDAFQITINGTSILINKAQDVAMSATSTVFNSTLTLATKLKNILENVANGTYEFFDNLKDEASNTTRSIIAVVVTPLANKTNLSQDDEEELPAEEVVDVTSEAPEVVIMPVAEDVKSFLDQIKTNFEEKKRILKEMLDNKMKDVLELILMKNHIFNELVDEAKIAILHPRSTSDPASTFDKNKALVGCGLNEVFMQCGSSCKKSCRALEQSLACPSECKPGCYCRDDYYYSEVKQQCIPRFLCKLFQI